jgi:hypothetical protein
MKSILQANCDRAAARHSGRAAGPAANAVRDFKKRVA